MRIISMWALCFIFTGCGGGLTPQQEAEYDRLGTKQSTLEAEGRSLEKKAESTFRRLGVLEKSHRAVTKKALSCGFKLKGDRLLFPFKHKPGYAAYFVTVKPPKMPYESCTTYGLKVRRK